MVTGELPFSGESPISVALKHLQDTFTEPRELNPEIPQSVENIITRSLAKDADKRYASAIELIDDLRSCLQADRLSEAKIELDNAEDEEATKVLPIIDEDMFDTQVASPKTNKFGAGSADDTRSSMPAMKTRMGRIEKIRHRRIIQGILTMRMMKMTNRSTR